MIEIYIVAYYFHLSVNIFHLPFKSTFLLLTASFFVDIIIMKGGDNVSSNFPNDKYEALAFLYVQAHNPESKSPTKLFENYQKAYKEIKNADPNTKWEY